MKLAGSILAVLLAGSLRAQGATLERTEYVMGTMLSVEVQATDSLGMFMPWCHARTSNTLFNLHHTLANPMVKIHLFSALLLPPFRCLTHGCLSKQHKAARPWPRR